MSQENVELVRRGHEAFRDSGEEAIFEYLHADIDLTPIVELLDAGTFHGHDGVHRFFQTFAKPSATSRGSRRISGSRRPRLGRHAVRRRGARQWRPRGSDDLQRLDRPAGEGRPGTRLWEPLGSPRSRRAGGVGGATFSGPFPVHPPYCACQKRRGPAGEILSGRCRGRTSRSFGGFTRSSATPTSGRHRLTFLTRTLRLTRPMPTRTSASFGASRRPRLRGYIETFKDFRADLTEVIHADERLVVTAARDGGRLKGSDAEVWNDFFHLVGVLVGPTLQGESPPPGRAFAFSKASATASSGPLSRRNRYRVGT